MSREEENTYDPYDGEPPGQYWHAQLDHAKEVFKTWETRGQRVVERYRDERDAIGRAKTKFNILWSNVQVMQPALYGRQAKPDVSRRHMDSDPVARVASTILERVISYEVEQFDDFKTAMNETVMDRLLPGRGTAWIRFEPTFSEEVGTQITGVEEAPEQRIDAAHAPIDYVYWRDFIHSPARTWDEVWWVGRWVWMTREEGLARFGEVFRAVPLTDYREDDAKGQKDKTQPTLAQKAKVCEIWNKRTMRVCWIAEAYPELLDEKDDPLGLEEFFPCPKPLYATMTAGSLIPVPDYCEYEDQARELDSLTGRITQMVKAIKVVGVYNSSFKELARLLTEGVDNKVFPVDNWGSLSEKGGLGGAFELLDVKAIASTVKELYLARETVKQTIYEISGISDILRGSTDPNETLGAQQMKANFGNMRLRDKQAAVAKFATDLFRLKAQIITKFYPAELLVRISGIQNTKDGQDPQKIQAALQMLQNSTVRDWQISVESDSLGQIDEIEEKQAAVEATTAIGGFLKEALPVAQQAPETLPMISEMLLFLVRRFRAGRSLEASIEQTMMMLQQRTAQSQGQPTPEQMQAQAEMQAQQGKMQADMQLAQMKAQMEERKRQTDVQMEQMKSQQDMMQSRLDSQIKMIEMRIQDETERYKAELDAQTKLQIAALQRETTLETKQVEISAADAQNSKKYEADQKLKRMEKEPPLPHEMTLNLPSPRTVKKIVRDENGRVKEIIVIPIEAKTGPDGEEVPNLTVNMETEPSRMQVKRDENGLIREIVEEP